MNQDHSDDWPNPEADEFRCAHCNRNGLIEQAATVQAYAGPEYVHADCELDWRVAYIERSTPLSWGDVSRDITWLIAQVRQLQSQLKVLEDYVQA